MALVVNAMTIVMVVNPIRSLWSQCDKWHGFLTTFKTSSSRLITIHMPQQTSKILLVRLTANKNAFLFQIRVTSFALRVVIKIQ